MIEIDGSVKSGSGTLLRYGISLATLLGEELHMWNIRAGRGKPGLRPQHRQSVLACRNMSHGIVEGAEVGSMEIYYKPGKDIKGGHYKWDIGTGGSTTMLAMTLLPVACFAKEPSTFDISGGLFQDFAPSAYHMKYVLFPTLQKMGINADLEVKRPGYAEQGGGIIKVGAEPVADKIKSIKLLKPGEVKQINGIAICSHLKQNRVSDRMAEECYRTLKQDGYNARIKATYDTTANHEGAALAIWAETDAYLFGSDRAGKRGRRAENIGSYVANNLIQDIKSGATVDRFLADQLIIYAALADGATEYIVPRITDHVEANLWLVEHILGKFSARTKIIGNRLKIKGVGYAHR
ncbi:MAG: RNA 3'-phosphate cyclase [Chloroflexi bacterium]|nr:RNA 3'-phosphate cyclase [Chloroflexota bacterium]